MSVPYMCRQKQWIPIERRDCIFWAKSQHEIIVDCRHIRQFKSLKIFNDTPLDFGERVMSAGLTLQPRKLRFERFNRRSKTLYKVMPWLADDGRQIVDQRKSF